MKPGRLINGSATNDSVSVTNSDTLVIAGNGNRHYLSIVNDGAQNVYLSFGIAAAVANKGLRLNANGGSVELKAENLWIGAIRGITASSSTTLTICEF